MDVNLLNPLFESFLDILPQVGLNTATQKNVAVSGAVVENPGVIVNIAMIGQLKGVILIGMDVASAKNIASKMMMGMEIADFDNLAQSAISELGNMVCANACTKFAGAGMSGIDISPPTLLLGEGGQVMLPTPKSVTAYFADEGISFNVIAALVKDKR